MGVSFVFRQKGRDPLYKTWHTSGEHLFMYVHSGFGAGVCREGAFPIKPGSLIFIAADTYHYTLPDVPEVYERSKITVPPEKFSAILSLIDDGAVREFFSGKSFICSELPEPEKEGVRELLGRIDACSGGSGAELVVLSGLTRLLFLIFSHQGESLPAAAGIIAKAIDHINKNICFDMDVGGICRNVGISKYHFCREFKKQTGMTVMEYVLKTRLVLAKTELEKTSFSVTQISEKCGFSSVSYFCRVFKEEEGVSPLRYRGALRAAQG